MFFTGAVGRAHFCFMICSYIVCFIGRTICYLFIFQLLNRCSILPEGCAACLKAIETKGVRAMAVLYLLLKSSNPSVYQQLPSSKGKGEPYLASLHLFY